jgi:hypothetical protein
MATNGIYCFLHGSAIIRRYVRKSSSTTLNEALCERQPDYYIYIHTYERERHTHMTVYIVLFNRTIK